MDPKEEITKLYNDVLKKLLTTYNELSNNKEFNYIMYIEYTYIHKLFKIANIKLSIMTQRLIRIKNRIYNSDNTLIYKPIHEKHFVQIFDNIYNHLKLYSNFTPEQIKMIDDIRLKCITECYEFSTKHGLYKTLYTTSKHAFSMIRFENNELCNEGVVVNHLGDFKCIKKLVAKDVYDVLSKNKLNKELIASMSNNKSNILINTTERIQPQTIVVASNIDIKIQLPNDLYEYILISEEKYTKCPDIPNILVPTNIKIDDSTYFFTDVLGCGAYGIVLEYANNEKKYSIKIVNNEFDNDVVIGLHIINNIINCKQYIINFCILQNKNPLIHEYYILMDNYEGSLLDLDVKNFSIINKINFTIQIIDACKCFKQNGMYYTDLKPSNILFTNRNAEYNFVFADIGSFALATSIMSPATYPHPYHHNKGFINIQYYEASITWSIYVLFLYFFTNIDNLYVFNEQYNGREHIKRLNTIKEEKIKKFMFSEMNPTQTMTFSDIYNKFNDLLEEHMKEQTLSTP